MKILSKEEEKAHYNYLLKGGIGGGIVGVSVGTLGVLAANRRYPAFRSLTIPFRTFLVASSGSFAAIICADRWSRSFEASRRPDAEYQGMQQAIHQQLEATKSQSERIKDWAQDNKYGIVVGSWVLSICVAFAIVSRNRFLSGQQKLVQARVYAQGLTLAVVIASLALEAQDQTSSSHTAVEVTSQKDQWKDMVASAENRLKERGESLKG